MQGRCVRQNRASLPRDLAPDRPATARRPGRRGVGGFVIEQEAA